MLAPSHSIYARAAKLALAIAASATLMSCATKKEPPLIADESAGAESALPWNKQEKWEGQGQMGMAAERMAPGGRY